jgi:hypothetical protein
MTFSSEARLDLEVIIIVSKMAREGEVVEEMTVSAKGLKEREAGRYFFSPVLPARARFNVEQVTNQTPELSSDER